MSEKTCASQFKEVYSWLKPDLIGIHDKVDGFVGGIPRQVKLERRGLNSGAQMIPMNFSLRVNYLYLEGIVMDGKALLNTQFKGACQAWA